MAARTFFTPNVVTGGDMPSTQSAGVIKEGAELDFGITQNIGIRGSSMAVFVQKMTKYTIPIFGAEVDLM